MTWKLAISAEAQQEFDDAFDYYEEKKIGLGDEFAECVREQLDALRNFPKAHAIVFKDARRTVVKRFPYCIYYVVREDQVNVIAIIHGKRYQRRWRKRV